MLSSVRQKDVQRCFLFSGLQSEEEKMLRQMIEHLHGKVIVPVMNIFSPLSTHVIAREFIPTEKVLGALAGGKWLLPKSYITDSYKDGHWLDENLYEFTNFNYVAAHCRRERNKMGFGPYGGWKILVIMGTSTCSRIFRRILAAGGAEIASKTDVSNVDFVITTKDMLEVARSYVDSVTPLVDVNYIKETLMLRGDPSDLKKHDLRYPQESSTSQKRKSTYGDIKKSHSDHQATGDHRMSEKQLQDETFVAKKSCIKSEQTTLTQFYQTSPRKFQTPVSQAVEVKKPCFEKCPPSVIPAPEPPQNEKISASTLTVYDVIRQEKDEFQRNASSVRKDAETNETDKLSDSISKGVNALHANYSTNIQESQPFHVCKERVNCSFCLEKTPRHREIISAKSYPETKKSLLSEDSDKSTYREVHGRTESLPRTDVPIQEPIDDEIECRQLYSMKSLVTLGCKIDTELCKSCTLMRQVGGLKPKHAIARKRDVKEIIRQSIRKRQFISRLSHSNMLSLPKRTENFPSERSKSSSVDYDSECVLNVPNYGHHSLEERELIRKETVFFDSCVDMDTNSEEIMVPGIDTLLLQVSYYLYPSAATLGLLLRKLVLETEFSLVHHRALDVAYRVLTFHPPVTTKKRLYYLSVLELAMQGDGSGSHPAWKFIRRVIESAQSPLSMDCDDDDEEEEEEEGRADKALNLLQFIVLLLTEDTRCEINGEAIKDLLTWRIFWGHSKNCCAMTTPIKQLLHIWVLQEGTSPYLRHYVSQLVTLLLEVTWRYTTEPFILVSVLPETLLAVGNELKILLRDRSSMQKVHLIRSLPHPWPITVICHIIFQDLLKHPEITFKNIMECFESFSKQHSADETIQPHNIYQVSNHSYMSPTKDQLVRAPKKILVSYVNKRNAKGETPLMCACIKNDVARVHKLLGEPGIDVNIGDNCGWTPLHEAALRGNEKCIELLLRHNCYPEKSKNTLYSYVIQDDSNIKVNVRAADKTEKSTPLHNAVANDELGSVRLLLDYAGPVMLEDKTARGETAFDLACSQEMLELLKSYRRKKHKSAKRLLSTLEHQMELCLILANGYLEISGNRHVYLTIRRHIHRFMSQSKQNGMDTEVDVSNFSIKDSDTESKESGWEHRKKGVAKPGEHIYIRMVRTYLKSSGKFEDQMVDKLFSFFDMDYHSFRKCSQYSIATIKEIEPEVFSKTLLL